MSASAEDEEIGPSIDSADPEERIAARRLRIGKRLEQLRRYFNDVDKRNTPCSAVIGNLILNWPKLLRPFDGFLNRFFTLYRCVYVRNASLHHFRYKEVRFNCFN